MYHNTYDKHVAVYINNVASCQYVCDYITRMGKYWSGKTDNVGKQKAVCQFLPAY